VPPSPNSKLQTPNSKFLSSLSSLTLSLTLSLAATMARSLTADLICMKYLTLVVNILFLITGAVLIGLGSYALTEGVDGISSVTISAGVITLGCLVFVVSFFGCLGAAKESRNLLLAYMICILLFILLEIAIGIAAYVMRDDIPSIANDSWTELYQNDRAAIERIEITFSCCGWDNTTDRAVPPVDDQDTQTCLGKYPEYTVSCHASVTTAIENSMMAAGIAAISVAALQLVCLMFSCCLFARLPTKKQKEEALLDEARRLNRDTPYTNYQSQSQSQRYP